MRAIRALGTLFATCSVLALGGAAVQAQDLKEAPGALYNWTSVYVGLHGGYASGDIDWRSDYPFGSAANRPTGFDVGAGIWGTQIGYMVQRGNWVFGGELSLSSGFDTDIKRDVDLWGGSNSGTMSARMNYLVMSSSRVGYSWGNVLGYAKIGTAGASIALSTDDNFGAGVGANWLSRSRHFYTGWVLGAGMEYPILPNLMLGVEYNYVTLDGKASADIVQVSNGALIGRYRSHIDLDSHSVLARLNYKMDAPALATLLPF